MDLFSGPRGPGQPGGGYRLARFAQCLPLLAARSGSFTPVGPKFIFDVAEHLERIGADVIKRGKFFGQGCSSRLVCVELGPTLAAGSRGWRGGGRYRAAVPAPECGDALDDEDAYGVPGTDGEYVEDVHQLSCSWAWLPSVCSGNACSLGG
jgi:hypothetical protein